MPLILTVSPDCLNLQNTSAPCSEYGCYGGAWGKKKSRKYFFFFFLTNQILSHQIISKQAAVSKSRSSLFFFFFKYSPKRTQSQASLTGQQGQRGWWRHSLECVWSGWGPASWPEGTARSRVPPLGFLLRSCHPATGALESKLLWRPKPEPQTAG